MCSKLLPIEYHRCSALIAVAIALLCSGEGICAVIRVTLIRLSLSDVAGVMVSLLCTQLQAHCSCDLGSTLLSLLFSGFVALANLLQCYGRCFVYFATEHMQLISS